MLVPVTQCLMAGLEMEPRVANNVCWAFEPLCDAAYTDAQEKLGPGEDEVTSYGLSPAFQAIVGKLLETTERSDASQENLRAAAYGALSAMFSHLPTDCYDTLTLSTPVVMQRLQTAVGQAAAASGKDASIALGEVQSHCCGLLQTIVRKLQLDDARALAPELMTLIVNVLGGGSFETEGVQEDALMLAGAVASGLGDEFAPYMDALKPYILRGLANTDAPEVCKISVELIGDFATAMKMAIAPSCDEFMSGLLAALQNDDIDSSVKPIILTAFADVAMSIGPNFANYFEPCVTALNQASVAAAVVVSDADYDELDDQNDLRQACMDAYTGFLSALKGAEDGSDTQVALIMGYVPHIVGFMEQLLLDPLCIDDEDKSPLGTIIGLIGDMVIVFQGQMKDVLKPDFCAMLLQKGAAKHKTSKLARWCQKQLKLLGM